MANLKIGGLASDPADANIAAGDLLLVERNNVAYKAAFSGALLLPAYTAADAGKTLQVNSAGQRVWATPTALTWSLLFTSPQDATGLSFPQALPANTLASIRSIQVHVDIQFAGQANFEELGFPVRNSTTATRTAVDGLTLWFRNATSFDAGLPTGAVVRQFWIYGQK